MIAAFGRSPVVASFFTVFTALREVPAGPEMLRAKTPSTTTVLKYPTSFNLGVTFPKPR
jgi:hypothetical protein